MKKWMNVFLALVASCGVAVQAADEAPKATEAEKPAKVKAEKSEVAKLRGKILYKKGQIRKIEKSILSSKTEVSKQAAELEQTRRDLMVANDARLADLYAELDSLERLLQDAIVADVLKKAGR